MVQYPHAEPERQCVYDAARQRVARHIRAVRAAFSMHLGQRIWHERERSHGRVDQRRLGWGEATDLVFRATRVQACSRLAICLLLDESGSMGGGSPSVAVAALDGTVLLVESLKGLPGIELEVYSHTSCNELNRDCLVRYLFGRKNPFPAAIGSYGPKEWNYDHQAIRTAARLFKQNTTSPRRLMLVLSDGNPAGPEYEGDPAIRATRESVETARRQGIQVMNIAVDNFRSEEIFGKSNVLKFVDLSRLVDDLRKLLIRVVRGAIENG